jgi:hypothetical protein
MADSTAGQKLKVFISCSRRDSADFADELVVGLELAGFAPFLDRHDIAVGEDWELQLGRLIQEADTAVFVVSPEAMNSERCGWEIDRALALSKRLLPVIFKPVPEIDIPQSLRRLQFVRFDVGPGLARPLASNDELLWIDPLDYRDQLAEAVDVLVASKVRVSVYTRHRPTVTPRESPELMRAVATQDARAFP